MSRSSLSGTFPGFVYGREVNLLAARPRERSGRVLRWLGTLFLLAALTFGGYWAWLLWGTGIETARAQGDLRTEIAERIDNPRWAGPSDAGGSGGAGGGSASGGVDKAPPADLRLAPGDPVAILRIPRIGLSMVVVEGTSPEMLKRGPGHYEGTALPWDETGRVAIAGHRTTYMQPFWALNELRAGDLIELKTEFGTFRYSVTRSVVTLPDATWVLDQTKQPSIVLTACEPRFSASHRLIVFGVRR